ncbi:hypothetical protein WR25_06719 [Diploscapter pachys]|uniref:Uncharacterized protein n=1 Tax=Diploscapter pachys TaxID=2018661 RepID=A0A2A2M0Y3_9BILA|nr:hypothetical protein WR25_06719 [Diploscapter pachys]
MQCYLLSETCAYPGGSAIFCELPIGMTLCPDRQFNPSGPESVGNLARVGRHFYQIKIADQHGSERIGVGRQKTADIRPDRPG